MIKKVFIFYLLFQATSLFAQCPKQDSLKVVHKSDTLVKIQFLCWSYDGQIEPYTNRYKGRPNNISFDELKEMYAPELTDGKLLINAYEDHHHFIAYFVNNEVKEFITYYQKDKSSHIDTYVQDTTITLYTVLDSNLTKRIEYYKSPDSTTSYYWNEKGISERFDTDWVDKNGERHILYMEFDSTGTLNYIWKLK